MHKRANGFTLIEVLLCLVVLATLMGVAVPAWSSMLARSHSASARAALLASLTTSINHAAIAGTEVVLCPATTLDCADSWDWSQGWIAYADLDGDRHHDAGEALLRQQPALHDDVLMGAAACLVLDAVVAERMLETWRTGGSTLVPVVEAVGA